MRIHVKRSPGRTGGLPVILIVALAALIVFAAPVKAQAREYEISKVDIDATLGQDGVLTVQETRTFDFDGSFNGVYWDIPVGYNAGNGKTVAVDVVLAGQLVGGEEGVQEFARSDSGADGTYQVGENEGVVSLKIFSAHADEQARFVIVYRAGGIATRWEDTGELYWKFVSDGWDVESQDVTCTLHLPVPAGQSVEAGQNVRAWGHGPLDASVGFGDGGDVVFSVPGVGTSEYAEMRVAFPAEWVGECEVTPGSALPTILAEEQQWADEANARRDAARSAIAVAIALGALLTVGTVALTIVVRRRYKTRTTPDFYDDYYRDVPTGDHPAVLGALFNGGSVEGKELTASLMRLTDAGVVRLERTTRRERRLLGEKEVEDYRLTKLAPVGDLPARAGSLERAAKKIDERTCELLFCDLTGGDDAVGDEFWFSQLERAAKADAAAYDRDWRRWSGEIEMRYGERFVGRGAGAPDGSAENPRQGMGWLIALGVIDIFAAVILLIALLAVFEVWIPLGVGLPVVLVCAAAAALVAAGTMKDLNREGVETLAKLEALRRWLKDFTRLDEAVPDDVVLWNRLLVMAVALGVADEVVSQLRVALPQMMDDPYFTPCYGWFLYGHGPAGRPPTEALERGLDSAHDVSAEALAASSSSSGGGGGGGFSGGGGGGFGGGGGGGAF